MFATDKVTYGYFQAYVRIAAELGPSARVLELGVAAGESLRLWQALFPSGQVTGVDSSPDCTWPPGAVKVVARHDDPGLPALLDGPFDLVVDDGCHVGSVVRASFGLLWPLVAAGGYYVVEDWQVALRDGERPGETWGRRWDDSMLRAAESFLPLLAWPDGDCESVTYRHGMIIIGKRKGAGGR